MNRKKCLVSEAIVDRLLQADRPILYYLADLLSEAVFSENHAALIEAWLSICKKYRFPPNFRGVLTSLEAQQQAVADFRRELSVGLVSVA